MQWPNWQNNLENFSWLKEHVRPLKKYSGLASARALIFLSALKFFFDKVNQESITSNGLLSKCNAWLTRSRKNVLDKKRARIFYIVSHGCYFAFASKPTSTDWIRLPKISQKAPLFLNFGNFPNVNRAWYLFEWPKAISLLEAFSPFLQVPPIILSRFYFVCSVLFLDLWSIFNSLP